MKKVLIAAAAASILATPTAFAQSAFEGFYGQIATGYESNSTSSLNGTVVDPDGTSTNYSASNQSFGGAPLVIGLGYNFSVAPKWVIGLGADYSAISQKSSTFSSALANGTAGAQINGQTIEVSNRFNIFVTPGYEIDKDKLVYLKAGYSSVQAKGAGPTTYTEPSGLSVPISVSSSTTTLNGYVLGLGYKQIITGGLYGFAEGNYMSYSKANNSGSIVNGDGSTSKINSNSNLSSYQLLVGVGYKF